MTSRLSQSELDREYSPSSCIDDINLYLDLYAHASQQARQAALLEGSCIADLDYGHSQSERLDLFLPQKSGPAPLQVYIHGGYWQALSKEDSHFAAPMFQRQGSFFAALNYSLAPQASLSEIVQQNRRAITWLYQNASQLGFDRDRIYVSGSSAGAHLAIMLLLTEWVSCGLPENVIKGACAVSGLYDLEPIRLSYVNDALGMDEEEAARNSPMSRNLRNRCPIILACGDNETNAFKWQTDQYKNHLIQAGEAVSFREIKNRNHFDVIMDLMNSDTWLSRQVLQQMQLSEL